MKFLRNSSIFHSFFQIGGFLLLLFWWKHTPPPSEAVLVIGVMAIIMTFSDMKLWNKALWLALVFLFAQVETKSIATDRLESSNRETALYTLAKDTADKADQTLKGVAVLSVQLSNFPAQIELARKSNDLDLVARLEKQREEVQKRLLLATQTDSVLATKARDIGSQLYPLWASEQAKEDGALSRIPRGSPESERLRITNDVHAKYLNDLKTLQSQADLYRTAILQRLPASRTETFEDKKWDVAFNQDPMDFEHFDSKGAGTYLIDIANVLSPKYPLKAK